MKQPIILLFGGRSSEHPISCRSVVFYLQNLDRSKYDLFPIGILKSGKWKAFDIKQLDDKIESEMPISLDQEEEKVSTKSIAETVSDCLSYISSYVSLNDQIKRPVVIPVTHGGIEEGGALQGMLDILDFPYVGCSHLSSSIGMDKVLTKQIAKCAGIPIVDFAEYSKSSFEANTNAIKNEILQKFDIPFFVKPTIGGSSVGVSKVSSPDQLDQAMKTALAEDNHVLIEAGISCRELEIAIIGDPKTEPTRVGEAIANSDFYSFEAKYASSSSSVSTIPADVPSAIAKKISDYAKTLQVSLRIDGMARLDFFYDEQDSKVYLNEINTLPGFTSISQYPLLWKDSGLKESELLDKLIDWAINKDKE